MKTDIKDQIYALNFERCIRTKEFWKQLYKSEKRHGVCGNELTCAELILTWKNWNLPLKKMLEECLQNHLKEGVSFSQIEIKDIAFYQGLVEKYIGQSVKNYQLSFEEQNNETKKIDGIMEKIKNDFMKFGKHRFSLTVGKLRDYFLATKKLLDRMTKEKGFIDYEPNSNYNVKDGIELFTSLKRKLLRKGTECKCELDINNIYQHVDAMTMLMKKYNDYIGHPELIRGLKKLKNDLLIYIENNLFSKMCDDDKSFRRFCLSYRTKHPEEFRALLNYGSAIQKTEKSKKRDSSVSTTSYDFGSNEMSFDGCTNEDEEDDDTYSEDSTSSGSSQKTSINQHKHKKSRKSTQKTRAIKLSSHQENEPGTDITWGETFETQEEINRVLSMNLKKEQDEMPTHKGKPYIDLNNPHYTINQIMYVMTEYKNIEGWKRVTLFGNAEKLKKFGFNVKGSKNHPPEGLYEEKAERFVANKKSSKNDQKHIYSVKAKAKTVFEVNTNKKYIKLIEPSVDQDKFTDAEGFNKLLRTQLIYTNDFCAVGPYYGQLTVPGRLYGTNTRQFLSAASYFIFMKEKDGAIRMANSKDLVPEKDGELSPLDKANEENNIIYMWMSKSTRDPRFPFVQKMKESFTISYAVYEGISKDTTMCYQRLTVDIGNYTKEFYNNMTRKLAPHKHEIVEAGIQSALEEGSGQTSMPYQARVILGFNMARELARLNENGHPTYVKPPPGKKIYF